ncbi:MAG: hypothetical protein ACRBBJ_10565 [Rhodomicrobiaceae bacterium]
MLKTLVDRLVKFEAIQALVNFNWLYIIAIVTGLFGWIQSVPIVIWLPSGLLSWCAILYLQDRYIKGVSKRGEGLISNTQNQQQVTSLQVSNAKSVVHFSFLSDWEAPFRQNACKSGYAEELWLGMVAGGNIENLKLKVNILEENEIKSEFFLETDFEGTIPKGFDQKIRIFRREWEWVSGRFIPNSEPNSNPTNIQHKVDKGAVFLDGSIDEFEALKGRNYKIIITALHKEGPDIAQFRLRQGGYRPETLVEELRNIDIVKNTRKAHFGECYLS